MTKEEAREVWNAATTRMSIEISRDRVFDPDKHFTDWWKCYSLVPSKDTQTKTGDGIPYETKETL